jgi:cytochrome c553
MHAEAHGISEADRDAVAAWLSAQVPTQVASLTPDEPTVLAGTKELTERVCATCHAVCLDGSPDGAAPNLTLQTTPYIFETLLNFNANQRHNGQMVQMARNLTSDEIGSLATFIGGLPPVAVPQTLDAASIARGEALALNGDPARALPACATCHGVSAAEHLPLLPDLTASRQPILSAACGNLTVARRPAPPD